MPDQPWRAWVKAPKSRLALKMAWVDK